jgi:hypothetical protein
MALYNLRHAALLAAVSETAASFQDLVKSELTLLQAELRAIAEKKVNALAWLGAGAAFTLVALVMLSIASAYGIAALGLGAPWAFLIVATVLAAIAAVAIAKGLAGIRQKMAPNLTLDNIMRDVKTAKERLL